MSEVDDWIELAEKLKRYVIWAIDGLGDAMFLAFWVFVQWLVNTWVVRPLKLTGMDSFMLWAFQVLFSISTLAPVAVQIYEDVVIKVLRTQRRIREEMEQGEGNEAA